MSLSGSTFIPQGPLIPSDSLTSKSKSNLTYPYYKLILPLYASTDDVVDPVVGMLIFNTTLKKLNFYTGTAWELVTST